MFSPESPSKAVWSEFGKDIYLLLVYCRLFILSGPLESVTLCIVKLLSMSFHREEGTPKETETQGGTISYF